MLGTWEGEKREEGRSHLARVERDSRERKRENRGGSEEKQEEGDWSAATRKTMIPLDEQREVQTVRRAEVGGRRVKNNKWTYETDGAGIGGEAGDDPCAETADGMEENV